MSQAESISTSAYVDAARNLGIKIENPADLEGLVRRGIESTAIKHALGLGATEEDVNRSLAHPESGTLTRDDSLALLRMIHVLSHARVPNPQ